MTKNVLINEVIPIKRLRGVNPVQQTNTKMPLTVSFTDFQIKLNVVAGSHSQQTFCYISQD